MLPSRTSGPVPEGLAIAVEIEPSPDVAALFTRRFGHPLPDFPHHVVARVRIDATWRPLCYIHFAEHAGVLLGGGACIDDRLLRRLDASTRHALRSEGGPYQATLRWAVARFASSFPAIFGYCGDALAERADRAVGFMPTVHPRLLAYFTRPQDEAERDRLIAIAHAVGPF